MLAIYKVTLKRNFERKTSYPSNSSSSESEEDNELEKRCSVQPSFKTALQSSFDDIISYTIKEDLDIANTIEQVSWEGIKIILLI